MDISTLDRDGGFICERYHHNLSRARSRGGQLEYLSEAPKFRGAVLAVCVYSFVCMYFYLKGAFCPGRRNQ